MKLKATFVGMTVTAGLLIGAPAAMADNSTVDQWNDPAPKAIVVGPGEVRPYADTPGAIHRDSIMAKPWMQETTRFAALGKSRTKSLCNKASANTEFCKDHWRDVY